MDALKKKKIHKYFPVIIVYLVMVCAYAVVLLYTSIDRKSEYSVSYSNTSNIDYNVYLKSNEYYSDAYLPKDKQYIASLIDYVDVDLNYKFKTYENKELNYSYYVTATVLVNNQQGKNIYRNEKTLVEKMPFSPVENSSFSLKENVKINYGEYNNLANSFIDNYGISAVSKVVVELFVNISGKDGSWDEFNKNSVISLDIPLTKKNVDITMEYALANNKEEIAISDSLKISNVVLFVAAIVLFVLDGLAIATIIWSFIPKKDAHAIYTKKLKKILRDYEGYITETHITESAEDIIKTRSLRIELVKSIDDLINVRDSVEKPILFHEDKPGEEAIFYIMDEKVSYIYIMRARDMDMKLLKVKPTKTEKLRGSEVASEKIEIEHIETTAKKASGNKTTKKKATTKKSVKSK